MKKKRLIHIFAVALVAVTALALSAPAGAASLFTKNITVATGASIFVDGVELFPTDAGGNPVETFIYNGTTYVPIRAVSEAFNKPVNWDGVNHRVYIGEIPGEKQYLLDFCPPYETGSFDSYFQLLSSFEMMGTDYRHGFIMIVIYSYGYFNLNGQYSTLEFDFGHVDGSSMDDGSFEIYLDGEYIQTIYGTPDMIPQHYSIPLNGALQLKIISTSRNGAGPNSYYGFGNVEIH